MRKNILAVVVISAGFLVASAMPTAVFAIGLPPFGGKVLDVEPCFGSSLFVATIQQPLKGPLRIAIYPSEFLYYMISQPNQFTVGLLGAPAFCATSPHSGFTAPSTFFYGTSAPGASASAEQAAPGSNQTAPM